MKSQNIDRMAVAYEDENSVKAVHFNDFTKLIQSVEITLETIVFNNLVDIKAKFLNEWETPVKNNWHKQFV